MLEGFKINCYPLNRSIRINIHLPKDYNETGRQYNKDELKALLFKYDAVLTGWGTGMLDQEVLVLYRFLLSFQNVQIQ